MQCKVEGRATIDAKRTAVFSTFGFLFLGCWQYTLYTRVMPAMFPGIERFVARPIGERLRDANGLRAVFGQVFIENGINNALLYFPCLYTVQAARVTRVRVSSRASKTRRRSGTRARRPRLPTACGRFGRTSGATSRIS